MSFKFTKSNLNFDVYAVASKPTAPGANNDIAIITSVPMPNWIMSPDKPSGRPRSDGDVWIQYSVTGNTFNALKNNTMMIATIEAWQYVDGAWADVEAVSCQNGEWVTWAIVLFPENRYSGQWVGKPYGSNEHATDNPTRATPKVSMSDDAMTVVLDTSSSQVYYMGSLFYDEPLNFKNKNTIAVKYSFSLNKASSSSSEGFVVLRVGKTMQNGYQKYKSVSLSVGTDKTVELSVSDLGDVDGYIAFEMYAGYAKNTLTIKEFQIL